MKPSILNQVFDQIYVINLDRSPDRFQTIDRMLRAHNVRYHRISAVDGRLLAGNELKQLTTKICGTFCTKGAIGCALSHRKIWQHMLASGYRRVLVLEDDATFGDNFESRFKEYWDAVPSDWGMVYVGCTSGCGDRDKYSWFDWMISIPPHIKDAVLKTENKRGTRINSHVAVPDSPTGSHAYAITAGSARKLLGKFDRIPAFAHIDQLIAYKMASEINSYAFTDGSIVTQPNSVGQSLIGTGGSPYLASWLMDRIHVNRRGVLGGWLLSEPLFRLGPVMFAAWQAFFFALGVALGRTKALRWAVVGLVLDELVLSRKLNLSQLSFNISLLLMGSTVSRYVARRRPRG